MTAGLLAEILRDSYGELGITGLRELGHGLDARVYRADSAALGPVALRVPHERWMTSGNEDRLDTRTQLRQDLELSRHLRAHGLPVPEVFALHADDSALDFTIAQFIESDGSELPAGDFGRLIRAVHDVPPPALDLVCMESGGQPCGDADEVLAGRIGQRLANLAELADLGQERPDIAAALAAEPTRPGPGTTSTGRGHSAGSCSSMAGWLRPAEPGRLVWVRARATCYG